MISPMTKLEVAVLSETGPVREENQDRMCGRQAEIGELFVVADGMGGHRGGARAAKLTAEGICRRLNETPPNTGISEALEQAFIKTNQIVYDEAHSDDPATQGMGSTAVVLLIAGETAYIAHVGDSRAYLYRKGRLRLLTTDHTKAQLMLEAGILTPEQARNHPNANVLERAIGSKPTVDVDISDALRLKDGDGLLLCTDGLSGYVDDEGIERVLGSDLKVQEVPQRLYELAVQNESSDNITVQFIQYGKRTQNRLQRKAFFYGFTTYGIAVAAFLGLVIYQIYLGNQEDRIRVAYKQAEKIYRDAQNQTKMKSEKFSEIEKEIKKTKDERKNAEIQIVTGKTKKTVAEEKLEQLSEKRVKAQEEVQTAKRQEKEAEAKYLELHSKLDELNKAKKKTSDNKN